MRPWIQAGPGTDSGSWAKWIHRQPLFIRNDKSKTTSTTPGATSSSSSSAGDWTGVSAGTQSVVRDVSTAKNAPPESFTTGLTMLMFNVAYLAHTQGLEIGLAQAGEILRNIWAVCCAPGVGRMSHETGRPPLPPPTPPAFALDFQQLLQVTSAAPAVRRREKERTISSRGKKKRVDDDDDWDLVEADG